MTDGSRTTGPVRATGAIARVLSVAAQALNATGTFIVLMLVVLINSDILSRNLLNMPFHGSYEMVQFFMVMIVFMQLPDVIRVNRLTRSDGFLITLADRTPATARIFARLIDSASAVFMAFIAYAIWPELQRSWGSGSFFGTPGIFTAPYWPIHLVILVSSLLSTVIFATKALTGRRRPDRLHLEEPGA